MAKQPSIPKSQCPPRGNPSCFPKNTAEFNATCCTECEPCGLGEGQCTEDYHCLDMLQCGKSNCNAIGFPAGSNCCDFPRGMKIISFYLCIRNIYLYNVMIEWVENHSWICYLSWSDYCHRGLESCHISCLGWYWGVGSFERNAAKELLRNLSTYLGPKGPFGRSYIKYDHRMRRIYPNKFLLQQQILPMLPINKRKQSMGSISTDE